MTREWMLRVVPLALVAVLATGCDSGTDPDDALNQFEGSAITAAVEAAAAPADASADANFLLADFIATVLNGGFSADPHTVVDRLRGGDVLVTSRDLLLRPQVDIPPEMQGATFIWNPETGNWEIDESRTGAPSNGLRVVWYETNDLGEPAIPLSEQGHVDITDEDTSTLEQVGVEIVRTAGGTVTLADFTQSYASTETSTGWTEAVHMDGFFSNGTDHVDFQVGIENEGVSSTQDETLTFYIFFEGPDGSYDWNLDSSWDHATQTAESVLTVAILEGGIPTVLTMDITDDEETFGEGTLSHRNVVIANVTLSNGQFGFTKPGGGSFTSQQQQELQGAVFAMYLYGPLILLSLPFFFL